MSNAGTNMALGQIMTNEVLDARILAAMTSVPREAFVPEHLKHSAYVDDDLDVGGGRFLMEPMIFARLLAMADIRAHSRVLCVGALTGYCAAVLAKLASHVVATESDVALMGKMRSNFQHLGIANVDVQSVKSLTDGYANGAPYHVIVLPGAIDFIPEELGQQIAIGGRLVAVRRIAERPGPNGGLGRGLLVKRIHNQLHYREHFDASVPLLPGFARTDNFTF